MLGFAVVVEGIVVQAFLQGRLQPWSVLKNIEAFIDRGTTYFAESRAAPRRASYAERTLSYTHGWVFLLVRRRSSVVLAGLVAFRRRDVT